MHTSAAMSVSTGSRLDWTLLFAREPEPDVEFTEEELEESANSRSSSPKTPKRSGGRPLLWVLLLVLAGGAAYLSMEPDMLMGLLSPILGESTPQPQVAKPPSRPGDLKTVSPAAAPTPAPVPSSTPTVQVPSPPPPPMAPTPAPAGMAQQTTTSPAPPAPLFGESQRVTVVLDPNSPGDSITLSLDASGTQPGPTIRPGMTLIVLDGELSNNSWVYAVRAEDGSKGWVAEKRLRLKF